MDLPKGPTMTDSAKIQPHILLIIGTAPQWPLTIDTLCLLVLLDIISKYYMEVCVLTSDLFHIYMYLYMP